MFVSAYFTTDQTDRKAHRTPWDAIRVGIVNPDGWTAGDVEDGLRVLERIRREVEARRRRCVAAITTEFPVVAGLHRSGLLSAEHIVALAPIRAHVDDVNVVAMWAVGKPPEDLRHEVEKIRLSYTAGTDTTARQQELRRLVFGAGSEGMIAIHGLLPPREGALLESMLRTLMDANWRHDHPERASELGGHGDDTRDQRRLDALLQLLNLQPSPLNRPLAATDADPVSGGGSDSIDREASEDHAPEAEAGPVRSEVSVANATDLVASRTVNISSAKPAMVIVFDIERYEAEILGHGPIPVTPDLFDPVKHDLYTYYRNTSGAILKFGPMRRHPTLLQRLAVEVRDRHCRYPSCRAPASRCHVHHLNEWLRDRGFTDVEVLGLFCDAHHRHLHVEELIAQLEEDGTVAIRNRSTGETIARATRITRYPPTTDHRPPTPLSM